MMKYQRDASKSTKDFLSKNSSNQAWMMKSKLKDQLKTANPYFSNAGLVLQGVGS
jgi:hypothetical protein